MPYSPYVRNRLQDLLLGRFEYVPPTTFYFALFIGDDEVSAPSYARVAVANDGVSFPVASALGLKNLAIEVAWPQALENWGIVDGVRVFDAATLGLEQNRATLAAPKNITAGKTAKFGPNQVEWSIQ